MKIDGTTLRALLAAGLVFAGSTSASAALMTFDLAWDGTSEGAGSATGQITLDDVVFDTFDEVGGEFGCFEGPVVGGPIDVAAEPVRCASVFGPAGEFPGLGITAFSMVFDGEPGFSFGLEDFSDFILTFDETIDPTTEMVGQDGFFDFNIFGGRGDDVPPIILDGPFLLAMVADPVDPPVGVAPNAFGFNGGFYALTSFRPAAVSQVPVPASALMLITAIGGLGAARVRRRG